MARLLRALASVGVFVEQADGRFATTPLAACLQTDGPGSLHAAVIMFGEDMYRVWGGLLHSVQTGETAFEQVLGLPANQYFSQRPEIASVFNQAMIAMTSHVAPAVMAVYDFSGIHTLVDVGGGYGTLLAAVLRATPGLRGVVFDLPQVAAGAQRYIETAGLADRSTVVGGDFLESVPSGGDAYILKSIIHTWDDERSIRLLTNCHQAMAEQATLLLVERVMPAQVRNDAAIRPVALNDLSMLVASSGHERTEDEFRALFAAAGLRLTRVIATQAPMGFSLIEGVRI